MHPPAPSIGVGMDKKILNGLIHPPAPSIGVGMLVLTLKSVRVKAKWSE
jgi:hypothetical protein